MPSLSTYQFQPQVRYRMKEAFITALADQNDAHLADLPFEKTPEIRGIRKRMSQTGFGYMNPLYLIHEERFSEYRDFQETA